MIVREYICKIFLFSLISHFQIQHFWYNVVIAISSFISKILWSAIASSSKVSTLHCFNKWRNFISYYSFGKKMTPKVLSEQVWVDREGGDTQIAISLLLNSYWVHFTILVSPTFVGVLLCSFKTLPYSEFGIFCFRLLHVSNSRRRLRTITR